MIAVVMAMLFSVFLYTDLNSIGASEGPRPSKGLIARYVGAMVIGGGVAGALFVGFFGRAGLKGWIFAILGGVLATVIAGVVGSALGLLPEHLADGWHATDLVPVLSGALILPFVAADWPELVVLWAILICTTHVWVRRNRA